MKFKFFIEVVLLIVAVLVGISVSQFIGEQSIEPESNSLEVRENDHVYGNPDAPIKIFEYAEVECVNCKKLHPILIEIMKERDDVALIHRHFPLIPHPKSHTEAHALECVEEYSGNETFWLYLTLIYKRSLSNNDTDLNILPQSAEEVGVPKEYFEECMASNRHHERIQEDIGSGFALGVDTVPQLFIVSPNNEVVRITRIPSYEMLHRTLDAVAIIPAVSQDE